MWKRLFGNDFQQVVATGSNAYSCGPAAGTWYVPSIASCPAGYTMTGGGYQLIVYAPSGGAISNAPDQSRPIAASGWYVWAGGATGGSCFQAFAICMK